MRIINYVVYIHMIKTTYQIQILQSQDAQKPNYLYNCKEYKLMIEDH